jgi:hypothetical protein
VRESEKRAAERGIIFATIVFFILTGASKNVTSRLLVRFRQGLMGKTVQIRRGRATVTGDEGLQDATGSYGAGKARPEDDPEARIPA